MQRVKETLNMRPLTWVHMHNDLLTFKGTFSPSRQGKLAKSGQQSTKGNLRKNTRKRQQWQRYLIWRKVCSREKAIQLNSFQDRRRVLKENPLIMVYLNLPLVALQSISQVKPYHSNKISITFKSIPFQLHYIIGLALNVLKWEQLTFILVLKFLKTKIYLFKV